MDPIIVAVVGVLFMFLLILLQVPIGIAMAVTGVVGYGLLSGFGPAITIIATETSSTISNPDLAVIPLFLLMGNFASVAGLSGDIYKLAYAFLGHRRGGLALSTVAGCGLFGAVCGSSTATAATFGKVALPEMLDRKYAPHFAAGCIAAGGTLGSLIPPSVILIIYAVIAEEFIVTLFIAAIIPGLISIGAYFIAIMIYLRINPKAGPAGPRMSWHNRFKTTLRCWAVILILLVVVGGIYGGVFTVTEAAAFGAVLAFLFAVGRRKMTLRMFWDALDGTAMTTAMIYGIIIGANIMTYFVTVSRMPDELVSLISGMQLPNFLVLTLLLFVYLLLGSIFDTVAAMLITLPFVLPLIIDMGYSPIWWGIVNVVVIEIGMITPPIGLNVFVLHGVAQDLSLTTIFRGIVPFLLADIGRLIILVVFPILILWLPGILG